VSACVGLLQTVVPVSGGHEREHAVATGVCACMWAAELGMLCVFLSKRMDKEDAMLEKTFGETWRAWAKRVPCRLVPGVY